MGSPKRLFGPALLTGSSATKYTTPTYVPSTLVTVVRKIHVSNVDATTAYKVTISIGADAAGTEIVTAKSVPPNDYIDIWGPFTLAQTEIIAAFADTTNKLNMTIDGYENEGP